MVISKQKPIDLNQQLLDDAVDCVRSVFAGGFGIDVKLKSSHIGTDHTAVGDISGIVGLVQERFEGNLILCFNRLVIFDILERVYEQQFRDIDSIVKQGAAELANMVYGQVKLRLNERGHKLQMALPSVVVGANHNIHTVEKCTSLMAVFSYDKDKEFRLFFSLQGNE